MEAQFWRERWETGQIGFHEGEANPRLLKHFKALGLAPDSRVFVPLCGKTRDIGWFRAQGHRVAGAELSEMAVAQLFDELGVTPQTRALGALTLYSGEGVDIFQGDIFALSAAALGKVDAIYDRAATVALPADMRLRYAAHLREITGLARQLVLSFEYDQNLMDGPPFSVDADEMARLHGGHQTLRELDRLDVEGGFKGLDAAIETVWLLS